MSKSKVAASLLICSLFAQTACVSQTSQESKDPASVSMPPPSSTPEKYHDQLGQAMQAVADGDITRGKDLLQKIIVEDPTGAEADLSCGIIASLDQHPKEAVKHFDNALQKNPRLQLAYQERGDAYRALKEGDKSISDLSVALLIEPRSNTYADRAQAYLDKKEYDKALQDANKAIEKDKNSAYAYRVLGEIWEKKGDNTQARASFDKSLEMAGSKSRPLYLYFRGNYFLRINEPALAQADYLAAAKETVADKNSTANDGRYNYLASLAELRLREFDKALANLDIFSQKGKAECLSKNVKLAQWQSELVRTARYDWQHKPERKDYQWAIACSSQLFKQNGNGLYSLGGEELTPAIIEREKTLLREWWTDTCREDLLRTLDYQLNTGHSALWRQNLLLSKQPGGQLLTQAADQIKDQTGVRLRLVREYGEKFGDRDLKAWDLCRYVCLVRWGYKVGWLTEAEAYERIMPVAKQLQKMYGSWQEMGEAYLVGRQFWNDAYYQKDKEKSERILHELLTEPDSPWVTLPWKTELK